MDMKHALAPAAFAASMFLAAPAWSAAPDDMGTSAKDRASATQTASAEHQSGAQNHTQGEVNEKCLREDPRKHPADVACAKLKSKRHPKVAADSPAGQDRTPGI